jgi:hypothetical protein
MGTASSQRGLAARGGAALSAVGIGSYVGNDLTAEQFVQLMDEAEVGRVMLSAWHRPGKWGISNNTVAAMVLDVLLK